MILNVNISCLSWGIIGGINKYNPLIKLRLNHAALIDLELFCCVLHWFGVVLLRSALIWSRFAAFCIILRSFCRVLHDLGSFCCVLQRFGVLLLRSALIWGRHAPFCSDFVSSCCALQRFGAVLLLSAAIWCSFSRE